MGPSQTGSMLWRRRQMCGEEETLDHGEGHGAEASTALCCWQPAALLGHYAKWCNWVKKWWWAVCLSLLKSLSCCRGAGCSWTQSLSPWCVGRLWAWKDCGFLVLISWYPGSWNQGGLLLLQRWVPDLWWAYLRWREWARWPGAAASEQEGHLETRESSALVYRWGNRGPERGWGFNITWWVVLEPLQASWRLILDLHPSLWFSDW